MKQLLILALLFSSCATQKNCFRKFPPISGRDSIYIEKLDTVKIVLPGDSIKITTQVPCEDFEIIQENGRLKQSLKVVNGKLIQLLNIKPDTVNIFTTNTITKIKEVPTPVITNNVPKFWRVFGITGIVLTSLLIMWTYLRFKKILL